MCLENRALPQIFPWKSHFFLPCRVQPQIIMKWCFSLSPDLVWTENDVKLSSALSQRIANFRVTMVTVNQLPLVYHSAYHSANTWFHLLKALHRKATCWVIHLSAITPVSQIVGSIWSWPRSVKSARRTEVWYLNRTLFGSPSGLSRMSNRVWWDKF